MNEVGIKLNGEEMCRDCGSCTKEHYPTIDDAIDRIEESSIV
jgi:acyl carrier protein